MSRTKKDRPFWVRSSDPSEKRVAVHYIKRSYQKGIGTPDCTDSCTIETSISLPRHAWKTSDDPCGYVLDVSRNYRNTPDRATRRSVYHRPNRQAARLYGARAAASYNTQEDWEDEGIPERANRDIKQYWRW